jgi:hypothetical protein
LVLFRDFCGFTFHGKYFLILTAEVLDTGPTAVEAGRLMRSADQTSTPARDRERRGALLADRMRGSIPKGGFQDTAVPLVDGFRE